MELNWKGIKECFGPKFSVVGEAILSVPKEIDYFQDSFFRALLLSVGLLAGAAGCSKPTEVVTTGGWSNDPKVKCLESYFDAYPVSTGRETTGADYASFGAKTQDYPWPENGYPMGFIQSTEGGEPATARVFLNTGPWVGESSSTEDTGMLDPTTDTELAIAGEVFGSTFGEEGGIAKYRANYASFCEDGSFIVTVYANITGDQKEGGRWDLQVVGKTIRPMEKEGEAFTWQNRLTAYFNLDGAPTVEWASTEEMDKDTGDEDVEQIQGAQDTGEVGTTVPGAESEDTGGTGEGEIPFNIATFNEIVEIRVGGPMKYDGRSLSEMWDALGRCNYYMDATGFRTY